MTPRDPLRPPVTSPGAPVSEAADVPHERLITTRRDVHGAVREALDEMVRRGAREAWFVDADFDGWPLGARDVVERLVRWSAPGRRLTVLARRYDTVLSRHARWVAWRRTWSHVVDCRAVDELPALVMPGLLLVPGCLCMHLTDPTSPRGVLTRDPPQLRRQREWVDAVLQRSAPAFPATLLGV